MSAGDSAEAGQTTTHLETEIPNDKNENNDNDTNDEENYSRRFCHFDHILWIIFLILSVYNYVTDMLVATDWANFRDRTQCPQFQGYCIQDNNIKDSGQLLRIVTTIGFIFHLIAKFYEFYVYIIVYKKQSSAMTDKYFFKLFKFDIFFSWFSIIFEDIWSLIIIITTLGSASQDFQGIDYSLIEQSLIISTFSLILTYANFMRKFFMNQRKFKENMKKNLAKCGLCLRYFCIFYWIFIGLVLFGGIIGCWSSYTDIDPDANAPFVEYGSYIDFDQCRSYTQDEIGWATIDFDDNNMFESVPSQVTPNCTGDYYEWNTICTLLLDGETDEYLFDCALYTEWAGGDQNQQICNPNDNILDEYAPLNGCDSFIIPFGTCGDYQVPCNFTQGDLVLYVCFDYCEYTLDN